MYAWFVTNDDNFEKLDDPPPLEPTLRASVQKRIVLTDGGYSLSKGKQWCEECEPRFWPGAETRRRSSLRRLTAAPCTDNNAATCAPLLISRALVARNVQLWQTCSQLN
jgi:hypothetical protein